MGLQSNSRPPRRSSSVSSWILATILALASLASPIYSQTLATTVPLILPSAVAFDSQGNLYLAETASHTVRKVDQAGYITTIAGTGTQGFSGDGGPATAAQLDSPQGLALDTASRGLYIADTHNHRIRRIDLTSGIIVTVAGSAAPGFDGDNGPATSAHLNQPTALAVDSDGALYIADTQNHRIRKITLDGKITTIAGIGTQGFSGDGGPATAAALDSPIGIALDSGKNLYIADTHNNCIRKISSTTGIITTIAGTGALGYSGDSSRATNANMALPRGLTVDAAGNVYLADTENHRIRRIDAATGTITSISGDGTQSFSGDQGPALQASLNTPQSPALSPSNLLVFADTGNQRVRQIAADSTIQTITGLGTTIPGALTLAGPSVTAYGSGHLIATLATSTAARGSVTFFDTHNSQTSPVGTSNISSNTANLDLSMLPAGPHTLTATYTGDQTHAGAQSSSISLTIAPLQLTASVNPTTLLYGQPIPALRGSLEGVLPRDTTNISAAFTTTASTLSPAGSYPITATLTGSAAWNYTVAPIPSFIITPAPTQTTLTAPPTTADPNQIVTITAHVASTTTGNPTGAVTLLDGNTPQLTAPVTSSGDATLTLSSLTSGTHSLSAAYNGDVNFTPSASTAYPLTITGSTSPADFTLTPSGAASQSIVAGNSAKFSFAVQIQNAASLSSPITFAASGLPNAATASFNPTYIPPGSTSSTFTVTIDVPKSNLRRSSLPTKPTTLAILLLPLLGFGYRKARTYVLLAVLTLATMSVSGCGDRIYTGAQAISGTTSYSITVTGTATIPSGSVLQHTANVTLVLQKN